MHHLDVSCVHMLGMGSSRFRDHLIPADAGHVLQSAYSVEDVDSISIL